MRAAILTKPGTVEMRDVAVPDPPPGGMVVRVRAALTDGTDLKAYRRGHPRMPMPTPFGHEFSGDVAAVDADCSAFVKGDAVMCVHTAPCGACFWCLHGQQELCESIMSTMILGAYAEYIAVPARIVTQNCFHKPADLPYEAAAFLEPVSCVVHSLDVLGASPGSTVLVMGDGGFGLLHVLLLANAGYAVVIAGRREERLRIAQAFGAGHVVNMREERLEDRLAALTQGRGADAAIECTGAQEVWERIPSFVRRGGCVSFFGGLPSQARVSFEAARMHYDEIRLLSPFHFRPACVKRARDLIANRTIDPRPLITGTLPLSDTRAVFERLDCGEGIKWAIVP